MEKSNFKITKDMQAAIFRAYDIRGVVGESLTEDVVYTIGLAIGSESIARGGKVILVARDGRLSGPSLMLALQQGLLNSGCDVIDLGMVPTPLLYYATHVLQTGFGVMLTGSHNPTSYNGLKMVMQGQTLTEAAIQELYQRILRQDFLQGSGQLSQYDITNQYRDAVCKDVHLARPLKVVVDAGNGIASCIAPEILRALGCHVVELFCKVDGRFPNHQPDPSQPNNLLDLIQCVKAQNADLGLAFDGDGDRLGVVTNLGEIIWPDRQMMLYAKAVLQQNPQATVVFDVKCSRHLSSIIESLGGKAMMWKTGHSFIKQKMAIEHALLGGEMSGHIFFKDRWYGFDDGIYTAVRLLEILSQDTRDVARQFTDFPNSVNTPELKLAIAEEQKFILMEQIVKRAQFKEGKITTIDGLRVDFLQGWGLVRPSNTSPYLTFRFEADDLMQLRNIQSQFAEQILACNDHLVLPF